MRQLQRFAKLDGKPVSVSLNETSVVWTDSLVQKLKTSQLSDEQAAIGWWAGVRADDGAVAGAAPWTSPSAVEKPVFNRRSSRTSAEPLTASTGLSLVESCHLHAPPRERRVTWSPAQFEAVVLTISFGISR